MARAAPVRFLRSESPEEIFVLFFAHAEQREHHSVNDSPRFYYQEEHYVSINFRDKVFWEAATLCPTGAMEQHLTATALEIPTR